MTNITQADIDAARAAFVACSNNSDVKRSVAEGKADGGVVIQVAAYVHAQCREQMANMAEALEHMEERARP